LIGEGPAGGAFAAREGKAMILYYSPGACSLVPHIALEEAQADFIATRITLAEGKQLTPDYLRINPHARVPAIEVEGRVITENVAILNFIAHRWNGPGSVPLEAPLAAARTNELLGWFASTVHIAFAQVWRAERFTSEASVHPAIQQGGKEALRGHFAEIEGLVADDWLVPGYFTAADTYALTFYRWGRRIGFDMSAYPQWTSLEERILDRAAVRKALEAEGLSEGDFRAEQRSAGDG
jgi:glutathione S-transferase